MHETTPQHRERAKVPVRLIILGLALAYLPLYLPTVLRATVGIDLSGWGPPAVIVWNWLAVGLLTLHVRYVEKLRLDSLLLRPPTEKELEWAGWLGGGILLLHWLPSLVLPTDTTGQLQTTEDALASPGPIVALLLVVTVAFTEEFLWRGYVVERLGAWIGGIPAAALSLAIFVAGHLPFFGPGWLLTGLPGAVIFYALLLWRRNLWACILFHFIVDIPIVFVALAQ